MARMPRALSSPDVAASGGIPGAIRRGRKPKAAITMPEPFSALVNNDAAADSVPTDADTAGADPTGASDVPRRGRGGRKPKQAAATATSPMRQEHATARRGRPPRQLKAEPEPTGDDTPTPEAASAMMAAAGSDVAQPDADPGTLAHDAASSSISTDVSVPSRAAAQWDRATDTVRFDWPEIERTAAQVGPNQAMAKLLLAARAEGEHSRWPF